MTIASEWPLPCALTCSIASSTESTTPTASIEREELGVPVLVGRLGERRRPGRRRARAARPSTRSSTPASRSARSARGQERAAASACTSSVSAALQTPGRWSLGVERRSRAPSSRSASRRRRRGSCPTRRRSPAPSRRPAAPPSGPRRRAG